MNAYIFKRSLQMLWSRDGVNEYNWGPMSDLAIQRLSGSLLMSHKGTGQQSCEKSMWGVCHVHIMLPITMGTKMRILLWMSILVLICDNISKCQYSTLQILAILAACCKKVSQGENIAFLNFLWTLEDQLLWCDIDELHSSLATPHLSAHCKWRIYGQSTQNSL